MMKCEICGMFIFGEAVHCYDCLMSIQTTMDWLGWDGQDIFKQAYHDVAIKKLQLLVPPTSRGWEHEVLMHKVELLGDIVAKLTKVIKV